ncbi:hypothetical protein MNV49_002230, partial [Pseudohyphozyma bogoriensis]
MSSLHLTSTRRATFTKRAKQPKWPFTLKSSHSIHPDKLAESGFYHAPTPSSAGATKCFLCAVEVSDWREGDDVDERHYEANPGCGWAIYRLALWEKLKPKSQWEASWGEDGAWWPRSDFLQAAREASFEVGWPHHGVKGMPTAKQFAQAGWFFTPGSGEEDADACGCPYCHRSPSLWEVGDDPEQQHHRKDGLKCPFFLATERPAALVEEEESPVEESEGGGIRLVQEEDDEEEEEVIQKVPTPKKSKGRASKAVSKSQSRAQVDQEEDEVSKPTRTRRGTASVAPSSDNESVAGTSKKSTRTSSRASKKPSSAHVLSSPASVSTTTTLPRSRSSKSLALSAVAEGEEEKVKVSKSRSRQKVVEEIVEEDEEVGDEEEVVVEKPAKTTKAKSSGKGKATKVVQPEPESEPEPELEVESELEAEPELVGEPDAVEAEPEVVEAEPKVVEEPEVVQEKAEVAKEAPEAVEEVPEPEVEEEDKMVVEEEEQAVEVPASAPAPKPAAKSSKSKKTKQDAAPAVVNEPKPEHEAAMEVEEESPVVPEPAAVDAPITSPKPKKKKSKSKSKTKAAPVVEPPVIAAMDDEFAPAPEADEDMVEAPRQPLAPAVASPSPRPIRSLPSKVNSPSLGSLSTHTGNAPAKSSRKVSNPFERGVPALTEEERDMTLEEWFTLLLGASLAGRAVLGQMCAPGTGDLRPTGTGAFECCLPPVTVTPIYNNDADSCGPSVDSEGNAIFVCNYLSQTTEGGTPYVFKFPSTISSFDVEVAGANGDASPADDTEVGGLTQTITGTLSTASGFTDNTAYIYVNYGGGLARGTHAATDYFAGGSGGGFSSIGTDQTYATANYGTPDGRLVVSGGGGGGADVACPALQRACPLRSGNFECIDFDELSSCGGCVSDNSGVDCLALKGVNGVGCIENKCVA